MNKTNKFKSTVSTLIMIALSFLIIYLLHDISKAIVGLLCGGNLEFNHGIKYQKLYLTLYLCSQKVYINIGLINILFI